MCLIDFSEAPPEHLFVTGVHPAALVATAMVAVTVVAAVLLVVGVALIVTVFTMAHVT
ncbi:hypothetical protein BDK61_4203 [Haloarcula quadrata]|uniref:Uncharacterized protein n=2 Tax=Haloarcula TaxID=2237 RepID=A0A495QWT7_9EURY|nr:MULTISPECIES: hypothetical protein [Haloarcula]QUJ74194.1 hypothetical protein KDQ40_17200 [Haloarcula sinaiiensis ATCC 33800]RKS78537.1 hypothetical protein BDK61_4203 [Haloarcula quadrata]